MTGKGLLTSVIILALLARGALAAPFLNLSEPFLRWRPGEGELQVVFHSRKEIDSLVITIRRLDGGVVFREERQNLVQGPGRWRWDGRLGDGGRIAPGHYRIVLQARFTDGGQESERGDLRVLPPRAGAVEGRPGFAPPPVPYQPLPYELSGRVRYFERWDNSKGQTTGDFRSTVRFRQQGTHHLVDLNLAYFRRSGGISNFDNSTARLQGSWDGGGIDFVFRRSLGDFDDPLRLFADFRSHYDKRGIRLDHSTGHLKVVALALRGYPAGGAEQGQAARISGRLHDTLALGLSYARRNLNQEPFSSLESRAAGLDLRWQPGGAGQLAFEHVVSDAGGGIAAQPQGRGRGDRLLWSFRNDSGLSGSLGYLDLSPHYNAAFSDPGNQVTSDAYGPEATLLWLYPGRIGPLTSLRFNGNLFYYARRAHEGSINQVDFTLHGKAFSIDFSSNLRSRQENGLRSTSLLVSLRRPLAETWLGELQYNGSISRGNLSQRLLLGASSRSGVAHNRRVNLEFNTRHGDAVANAPVYEYGLLLSGREGRFSYETILRYTHAGNDTGTNLFARAAYDTLWLHRYAPMIYLSIGDRSTVRTAARIEVGLEVRF